MRISKIKKLNYFFELSNMRTVGVLKTSLCYHNNNNNSICHLSLETKKRWNRLGIKCQIRRVKSFKLTISYWIRPSKLTISQRENILQEMYWIMTLKLTHSNPSIFLISICHLILLWTNLIFLSSTSLWFFHRRTNLDYI